MTNKKIYDFIIVGGGIVGVSTALTLIKETPSKKILLLEKEKSFAHHQTGHNSGVIHAGVYYEPGSLKAEFCREGLKETIAFCNTHGIPYGNVESCLLQQMTLSFKEWINCLKDAKLTTLRLKS